MKPHPLQGKLAIEICKDNNEIIKFIDMIPGWKKQENKL